MAALTRIYTVTDASTGRQRLIRAVNSAAARNFAASTILSVAVSKPDELINLTKSGHDVEDSSSAPVVAATAPVTAPAADNTEEQEWA